MSKFPFFLFSSLLASTSALASSLNCNKHTSCEEMGYSKADVPGCKDYLYCLYDHNYKVCLPDCGNSGDTPSTCPTGKLTEAECNAKGGIAVAEPGANGCYECQMCPLGEFKIFDDDIYDKYGSEKARDLLDAYCSSGYVVPNGDNYSCCSECAEGEMTEEQCTAQGGFWDSETTTTGITGKECNVCQPCDGTLYIKGCHGDDCNQPSFDEFSCKRLNNYGANDWKESTVCCYRCESGCPEGSIPVTSGSDIKGSGTYCIYKKTTLDSSASKDDPSYATFDSNGSYIFVSSSTSCSGTKLTLSNITTQSVESSVYTIIERTDIAELTLKAGGKLQTKSSADGILRLDGNSSVSYDFSESWEHVPGSGADYIKTDCLGSPQFTCDYRACSLSTGYNLQSSCKSRDCTYEIVQGSSRKRVSGTIGEESNNYHCVRLR